MMAKISYVAI